jgi:hypothetical protein
VEVCFRKRPLRVKRVGFVTSPVCPVYPKQQTFPDPVGTSHLCQERTFDKVHNAVKRAAVELVS